MHALPSLDLGGTIVRLPLSQSTAAALVDALLADDAEAQTAMLAAAVGRDASLAVWMLCRAGLLGFQELTTTRLLAAWLAPRLAEELSGDLMAPTRVDAAREKQLARLAQTAQRVAENGGTLAKKTRGADAEAARLVCLVHAAEDWLMSAGAKREAAARAALPTWLAAVLAESRETGPLDPTKNALAAIVRTAHEERVARGSTPIPNKSATLAPPWRLASTEEARRVATLAKRLVRLERLETRFAESLEAEKLEALAELAAGAGHEFNPPLAVISGRAQLFLRDEQDAERRRELALINRQALRVHEMIADLMHFARPARPRPTECDVVVLVREALDGLQSWAAERRITAEFVATDAAITAELDATQMQVALRAVVTNAIEALGTDGLVRVDCGRLPRDEGVEITIRDTGPGITPEVRRHLFDPFYSGRGAGRGLGLGLSKCWRIVTNHGGRVEVDSTPGEGTTVRLLLPRHARVPLRTRED